MPERHSPICDR